MINVKTTQINLYLSKDTLYGSQLSIIGTTHSICMLYMMNWLIQSQTTMSREKKKYRSQFTTSTCAHPLWILVFIHHLISIQVVLFYDHNIQVPWVLGLGPRLIVSSCRAHHDPFSDLPKGPTSSIHSIRYHPHTGLFNPTAPSSTKLGPHPQPKTTPVPYQP